MKFKILILLLFASIISKAQYYNIVTLTNNNGKIQAINPLGKQAFELNCKDLIWYEQPDTKIVIRDYQNPGTLLCVLANNVLTTPLFSNIKDSLRIWQLRCGLSTNSQATIGFDTTQTDTSLIQSIQLSQIIDSLGVLSNKLQFIYKLDTTNVDTSLVDYLVQFENLKDSLNVIINKLEYIYKLDTSQIDTSLINYIAQFDRQNDSLSKIIDLLKNIKDTSNQAILEQIRLNISDSLRTSFYINNDSIKVYVLNNYIDSTYYVLIDSIVKLLQKDTSNNDTLKTLVYKPLTKNISGTEDTLYNCKGISFRANSGASGTLILYYEDGESDAFNVATEDLPYWDNSTFISFVGYDASGVSGVLRINSVGCSQVPENVCAKIKPIINCTTNTPILQCSGWASASGIWNTISGCWNTGQ